MAENEVIILCIKKGLRVVEIADLLGRSRYGVYKRLREMRGDGRLPRSSRGK